MKKIFLAVFILCCTLELFSQVNDRPREVTDVIREKIESEVEKEIVQLKSNLEKKDYDKADIEFVLDTSRIELYMSKYMDYDYSTQGMVAAAYEAKENYDKLLNKYYQKLMSVLKKEDKQILTQSQRSWISFRDNETKLIRLLAKEEYSGGGTIQNLNVSMQILGITRSRVMEIYSYYHWTLNL